MNDHNTRVATAIRSGTVGYGGLFVIEVPPKDGTNLQDAHERTYLTAEVRQKSLAHLLRDQEKAVIGAEMLNVCNDWSAWLVSYQGVSSTLRVLMPLIGTQTARFIDCAARGEVFLVVTSCEEEDIQSVLERRLEVSEEDIQLLRRHWRPNVGPAAAGSLIQAMDIVLLRSSTAPVPSDERSCAVLAVILHADIEGELSSLLPQVDSD